MLIKKMKKLVKGKNGGNFYQAIIILFAAILMFNTVVFSQKSSAKAQKAQNSYVKAQKERMAKAEKELLEKLRSSPSFLGIEAFERKDYEEAYKMFYRSLAEKPTPEHQRWVYFKIAQVDASTGRIEQAFKHLTKSAKLGLSSLDDVLGESVFFTLHKYPEWKAVIELIKDNFRAEAKSKGDNPDILILREEEIADIRAVRKEILSMQTDREINQYMKVKLKKAEMRRQKMREFLRKGLVITSNEHQIAALIFLHSERLKDIKFAKELAERAFLLEKDEKGKCSVGRLIAIIIDRIQWHQGKPQIYGMQQIPTSVDFKDVVENLRDPRKHLKKFVPMDVDSLGIDKITVKPIDLTLATENERKRLCTLPSKALRKAYHLND